MKGNAAVVNAMTIDVEDYFHVSAFSSSIGMVEWDRFPLRVEANVRRLLDLLHQNKVQATFFVLGWVAQRLPHLVRDIARNGHEIACHGMTHQLVYQQTPEMFWRETEDSKSLLEDIAQRPVVGYRAASYSITRQSLWAMEMLAELGFLYDSSIFPIRHDRYGIPGASVEPYRHKVDSGQEIAEFPLATKSIFGYRLPVGGGGYFRLFPYSVTRHALRSINRIEGRPFVFYLHPWEIDPGQPRVRAGWLSTFRHYNNLGRCEERLKRLLGDFQFDTVRHVLTHLGLLHSGEKPEKRHE